MYQEQWFTITCYWGHYLPPTVPQNTLTASGGPIQRQPYRHRKTVSRQVVAVLLLFRVLHYLHLLQKNFTKLVVRSRRSATATAGITYQIWVIVV